MKGRIAIPEPIWNAADALDPYGIVIRYPSENRVDEHHTKQALMLADRLVRWARETSDRLVRDHSASE